MEFPQRPKQCVELDVGSGSVSSCVELELAVAVQKDGCLLTNCSVLVDQTPGTPINIC
jgi:hypothetical protein